MNVANGRPTELDMMSAGAERGFKAKDTVTRAI